MKKILSLDQIKKADRSDLQDVLRELKETQELCRRIDNIIEEAPDGIYVTDGDANAIRINPAFVRISGLDRNQMLGVNHRDLEKNGVVARSSALMAIKQRKEVTIIHEYLKSGLEALVTSKPVFDDAGNIQMVVSSIRDATELSELKNELEKERERLKRSESMLEQVHAQFMTSQEIIAADKMTQAVLYMAARVASVESTVLITGETGSGKEGVAKYIHNCSPRKDQNFVAINCGAIPETLVESELFGYEKGAFTGARAGGKPGLLELADQGTVFLDEVGELAMDIQVKLLRAMEEQTIMRVGGTESIKINIRVIAATNRDLKKLVADGKFRADLYFRLNVVNIYVPALRERKDDIIPLARHFLEGINQKYGFHKIISNAVYGWFLEYNWPGNVRELRNMVESLAVTGNQDLISEEDLIYLRFPIAKMVSDETKVSLKERLERMEYLWMLEAYKNTGNIRDAASSVQFTSSTFGRKLKEYKEKYGVPDIG